MTTIEENEGIDADKHVTPEVEDCDATLNDTVNKKSSVAVGEGNEDGVTETGDADDDDHPELVEADDDRKRRRREERRKARLEKEEEEREEALTDEAEMEDVPIDGVNIQGLKVQPSVNQNKALKFPYDYKEVIHKSILFYEAQRSGILSPNNRIKWRGDSCLNDQGQNGEDLTGGWFDAGDHIKFGLPMAWSTTVLAWGLIQYKNVYKEMGELETMLDCIKWPADYFIKCHTNKNEFYHQVGDPATDHKRWEPPETINIPRPSFKVDEETPGSDVVGETSAALAACAMAFQDTDKTYARMLLDHSLQLYEFASTFVGKYPSDGYYDVQPTVGNKLAWAAAWIHYATGSKKHLADAKKYYRDYKLRGRSYSFGWDNSTPGVQLLLYLLTGEELYKDNFTKYLDCWMPNNKLAYTPKGLVYRNEWGPLRYAANNAFLAVLASDYEINRETYLNFAMKQIHYILGDSGRSFVCGFGINPPHRPHHRASSTLISADRRKARELFLSPGPNPNILYGAMVGGPDINDNYNDTRGNYVMNEVATDYNAGFQSAIAGLKRLQMQNTKHARCTIL
ncbi:endoglucanase F-like [Glandiceps talaboti]